jgi:uncharacterized membrane protein YidH (DUF202 family)
MRFSPVPHQPNFLSKPNSVLLLQNNKSYFANERTFIHWLNM